MQHYRHKRDVKMQKIIIPAPRQHRKAFSDELGLTAYRPTFHVHLNTRSSAIAEIARVGGHYTFLLVLHRFQDMVDYWFVANITYRAVANYMYYGRQTNANRADTSIMGVDSAAVWPLCVYVDFSTMESP